MRFTRLHKRFQTQDGFTLIEMVVALFIVGVVTAIALPNLQAAGVNAARIACQGDEKMIGAALSEYYLNSGQFPSEATVALDLADLKTAGYLNSIPVCPNGGSFIITMSADGSTATVTSSVDGELGIHETD